MEVINKVIAILRDNVSLKTPLSEGDLRRLKEQGQEVLTTFSVLYVKNVGLALFDKANEEFKVSEDPGWKLKRREFHSLPSTEHQLYGYCFVKKGEGAGAFGRWSRKFLVAMQFNTIEVYNNDQDHSTCKKPKYTISMAGYKLVRNVDYRYSYEMRHLVSGLGLTELEVKKVVDFSPYSWALYHPQRPNYIFHITDPKGVSMIPSPEQENNRRLWIEVMENCTKHSKPRDLTSITGIAFQKTCEQISDKIYHLWYWRDDGTEAEMLVDMLMEACLPDFRQRVLSTLLGPSSLRLGVWYKIRGVIFKTMMFLVEGGWNQMQKMAGATLQRIEPTVNRCLRRVAEFKSQTLDKLKNKIHRQMEEKSREHVAPFIRPILDVLDKPLQIGFGQGRALFDSVVIVERLPDDRNQRNKFLDEIPRSWNYSHLMRNAAYDMVEPLFDLKHRYQETFVDLDVYDLRYQAESLLMETLDSAIYTLECKLDNRSPKNQTLKQDILRDFDNDSMLARSIFMQEVISEILMGVFKKAISPLTDPIVEEFKSKVPEEIQLFIEIDQILDAIVETVVREPVKKMIESAYPKTAAQNSVPSIPGKKEPHEKGTPNNQKSAREPERNDNKSDPIQHPSPAPRKSAEAATPKLSTEDPKRTVPSIPGTVPPIPGTVPSIPGTVPSIPGTVPSIPGRKVETDKSNQSQATKQEQSQPPKPARQEPSQPPKQIQSQPLKESNDRNNNSPLAVAKRDKILSSVTEEDDDSEYENWDDSLSSVAMWTGDPDKGKAIMKSLLAFEGAYMIRSSRDGTGYTLCVICSGKGKKFKIITDESGKYCLVKHFNNMDDMIKHFTSNNLPNSTTTLAKNYWELTNKNKNNRKSIKIYETVDF